MKPKKTSAIRAKELFKMVNGCPMDKIAISETEFDGWLKLGKMVLNLETKWANVNKQKNNWREFSKSK